MIASIITIINMSITASMPRAMAKMEGMKVVVNALVGALPR